MQQMINDDDDDDNEVLFSDLASSDIRSHNIRLLKEDVVLGRHTGDNAGDKRRLVESNLNVADSV